MAIDAVLDHLFGAAAFVPHGYCLLWRPDLVALHVVSDVLTATAYYSIPAAIVTFVRRRPDLRYRWIAWLFALFITACGTTHVIDVLTLWQPVYGLQGLAKLATALVSMATAVLVWPMLPRLVALPSPAQLERKNAELEAEIRRRHTVEAELRRTQEELEQRVRQRTCELELANLELRRSGSQLSLALDAVGGGLIDADLVSGFTHHNPRALEMLGFTDAPLSVRGEEVFSRVHPDDHAALLARFESLRRGEIDSCYVEHRQRCHDGTYLWVAIALKAVERNAAGMATRVIGIQLDISERKQHEQWLAYLAMHDALTGLPNRVMLRQLLDQELAQAACTGGRFGVLLADLDRFKDVNDNFGHAAGDELLRQVAGRLAAAVRQSDVVARLGGDEFAILLREPGDAAAVQALAKRLIRATAAPFTLTRVQVQVGLSLGAAIHPDDADTVDTLFVRADLALYAAKHGGRNCVRLYSPSLEQETRHLKTDRSRKIVLAPWALRQATSS